jgi:mono/diheme cytochrome c family protein
MPGSALKCFRFWLAALLPLAATQLARPAEVDLSKLPPPEKREVDFAKDIQPILAAHCYSCHGSEKQKADLRWDVKDSAFKSGDNGPVIVPGNSAQSRVVHLVAGLVPDTVMPPKGEPLTPAQIGLLRAWIDQGAKWPESRDAQNDSRKHWAFKPPERPRVAEVKNRKWVRNPIDRFILARLEKEKLKPSPEADRVTLIRRLSLDLIGLPPTPKEVDEFLADKKPDAYERLVERLFASPHYGEKWARHWLDVARYADTNGYEKDKPRSIWPYRDWVINAFNRDLPFDQFAIEQIAGDLLPNATVDQRVATGFFRNSMMNQEGGIEPEQFRVEALIDRMDTLGKSFLGLTINCAQCHNHKYDPFTQKEYYQLYAFLNNDDEAFLEVPTPEQQKQRDEIRAKARELEEKAIKEASHLKEGMAAWEKRLAEVTTNWTVLDPKDWHNFATKFEKQDDRTLLGGGDLQAGGLMRVWVDTDMTNITGFRLEALTNPNLIYGGPGLQGKGSFLVKEFAVEAYAINSPTVTNKVKFRRAIADMEAPGFAIANAIDGNTEKGGWTPSITPQYRNQGHRAVFECEEPLAGFPDGTRLLITIHETVDSETKLDCHMLGCFRLSATTDSTPLKVDPLSAAQRELLSVASDERTPEQQRELFGLFRLGESGFAGINKRIDDVWTNWPYPPTSLVLQQRPAPRETHIFKRGDRLRPGEVVQAGVPSVLNPLPDRAPQNRLGLAQWLVDRRNPTVARVAVNRIWNNYFGEGIVTTPEDFGTRVAAPSHPELLDWLASEFVSPAQIFERPPHPALSPTGGEGVRRTDEGAWSLKRLHRLIVTSATYRQSSKVTPELYAKDPYNRLLARGPRFRVEGEVVQDVALAASGLLNAKIGGPSIYPPIPGNVGDTAYGGFTWPETKGPERYRRALYTFWKRSLPFPSLSAFDVPSGEFSCPRRVRSNTPLQALTTLNERTFVEAAQAMALRIVKEGGQDNQGRAKYAFRLCTGRTPSASEVEKVLAFWQEQFAYFENRSADAIKVAVPDVKDLPAEANLHKVAAWAMVSRAILNLDETITKE